MQPTNEKSPSIALYLGVYVALMILLALTAGAAYINLGALNTPVALGIAALKALLVAPELDFCSRRLVLASGAIRSHLERLFAPNLRLSSSFEGIGATLLAAFEPARDGDIG